VVPTFNIVVKGYLTRALKALLPRTRILALDADKAQTIGAQRWERQLPLPTTTTKEENILITHKTIHITPKKLFETVDEWIKEDDDASSEEDGREEIPVLLVGLHACGSLTPDIIRTFGQSRRSNKMWKFAAAVVIGCCYNLMNPGGKSFFFFTKTFSRLTIMFRFPVIQVHVESFTTHRSSSFSLSPCSSDSNAMVNRRFPSHCCSICGASLSESCLASLAGEENSEPEGGIDCKRHSVQVFSHHYKARATTPLVTFA